MLTAVFATGVQPESIDGLVRLYALFPEVQSVIIVRCWAALSAGSVCRNKQYVVLYIEEVYQQPNDGGGDHSPCSQQKHKHTSSFF